MFINVPSPLHMCVTSGKPWIVGVVAKILWIEKHYIVIVERLKACMEASICLRSLLYARKWFVLKRVLM